MIYTDLEKIYKVSDIENKYALAMAISTRARLLSEQKGRQLDGEGSERYITHAIEEIESGKLKVKSTSIQREGADGDASEVGVQ
ncbi:MAG: DNA-directed RNA polymerase subunit omega [Synergistaceae bacterium]|jgi:DNA-directed RNA polymerase omega subunit|nr:DNA-directed RNA polymerase subunit omega [Synergistaceae bacterium]